jgi:hypothetical protein
MPQRSDTVYRSALADRLAAQSLTPQQRPIQSTGEGLANMGSMLAQAWGAKNLRQGVDEDNTVRAQALAKALAGGDPAKEAQLSQAIGNDPGMVGAAGQAYFKSLMPDQTKPKDRYMNVPGVGLVDVTKETPTPVVEARDKPQTVNTAEGVFVVNRDGTLGQRLGGPTSMVTINQAPTGYEKTPQGLQAVPGGPADPSTIEKQERVKAGVKSTIKKEEAFPKAQSSIRSLESQWTVVDDSIDKALEQVGPFTAGPGSILGGVPGTEAKDLQNTLNTIKANIGFDKLQSMRDNSPTGGALGQVSEFENRLLQSVQGSLEPDQSPTQLKVNLQRVKRDLAALRAERAKAFQQDYADFLPKEGAKPGGGDVPEGTIIDSPDPSKPPLIRRGGQWVPYDG